MVYFLMSRREHYGKVVFNISNASRWAGLVTQQKAEEDVPPPSEPNNWEEEVSAAEKDIICVGMKVFVCVDALPFMFNLFVWYE